MNETEAEDDAVLNVKVPQSIRDTLDRARVVDGVSRFFLAEVTRRVLSRAIARGLHLNLDQEDHPKAGRKK